MLHLYDWIILVFSLVAVLLYGLWKNQTAKNQSIDSKTFLTGKRESRWWTIGLSIMATQASAVTFLSTPGQGYAEGLKFVQFYFGLPIAMVFLAYFVLPIYYRLNISTAYEYLETRFDLRMRSLTAALFLIQRSLGAAITLYAPSIVLSAVFGWNLNLTILLMGGFVVIYTLFGGHEAVGRSQEAQMSIMLGGLVFALGFIIFSLPKDVGLSEAWGIARYYGRADWVSWKFSFEDRYTFWSGVLGATFLFLSYFGTDQSQVGRYLSGRSLSESRFGLLFNGVIKIPMQFLVLLVGVMVFVFYQFNAPPLSFSPTNRAYIKSAGLEADYQALQARSDSISMEKKRLLEDVVRDNGTFAQDTKSRLADIAFGEKQLKESRDSLLFQANPKANPVEKDYVFLAFVLEHLPKGLVGLILAMIFSAAWSTAASELSALTTTGMCDLYRRTLFPRKSETHYLRASKWMLVGWGVFILFLAQRFQLFENLIQAVNMIGSVFYGTILGIFFTGFFTKKIGGSAVFYAAVLTQSIILTLFFGWSKDPYLWYNPLGCFLVMGLAKIIQIILDAPKK